MSLISLLRKEQFDVGLLLTNSFSSAFHFFAAQIPIRIGFTKRGRDPLITHRVAHSSAIELEHQVVSYQRLLAPLGVEISSRKPHLVVADDEVEEVKKHLPPYSQLIILHPGAAYGSAKCWLPDRFRVVARELLRKDPNRLILLVGTIDQIKLLNTIGKGLGKRVVNLGGKTSMRELLAYLKCAHLLLTNDSGPMHMGAALKTPLIALFGSTSSQRTSPYLHGRVIEKKVSCSPCFERKCPLDFACMKKIEAGEVLSAMEAALADREEELFATIDQ